MLYTITIYFQDEDLDTSIYVKGDTYILPVSAFLQP